MARVMVAYLSQPEAAPEVDVLGHNSDGALDEADSEPRLLIGSNPRTMNLDVMHET